MELLPVIAIAVSIATPLLTAAVAYGVINGRMDAKLQAAHDKAQQAYDHADRAHVRIDAQMVAR